MAGTTSYLVGKDGLSEKVTIMGDDASFYWGIRREYEKFLKIVVLEDARCQELDWMP